jgi:uncharacterized protein YlzI (FlbEa/FlbD family)
MFYRIGKERFINLDNVLLIEADPPSLLKITLTSGKKFYYETEVDAKVELKAMILSLSKEDDVINS